MVSARDKNLEAAQQASISMQYRGRVISVRLLVPHASVWLTSVHHALLEYQSMDNVKSVEETMVALPIQLSLTLFLRLLVEPNWKCKCR
jgi:hypothetical protein